MADLKKQIAEAVRAFHGNPHLFEGSEADAVLAVVEPAIRQAQARALSQYASDLKANSCADVWDLPDYVNDIRDYAGELAAGDIDIEAPDRDGTPDAPQQPTQPRTGAGTDGITPDAGQAVSGDESA